MPNPPVPDYVGLAPMLPVTSVAGAIAFYESLGLRVGGSHTPEGGRDPVWAWLSNGRAHLMVNQAAAPIDASHHSASLWLYVKDVKEVHALLRARGVDVGDVDYPFYNPGGEFHVHDPDGYAVFVAHADSADEEAG